MDSLFLNLLNISITAGWIVLAVIAIRLLFKKAPKYISCLLWIIVAIRLVCPFSFESVLSLIPSTQTIPETVITEPQFNVESGVSVIDNNINPYLSDHYFEGITVPTNTGVYLLKFFGVVWLAGMIIMLAYMIFSFIKIRTQVSAKIRIDKNIFICDEVKAPFIMGIIRPEIYLPSDMREEQKAYVISHELAHLKRHDNLWKPLGFIILSVYWFNPLMWVAYILLCRDIESACDEKVIKNMSNEERAGYSQALLDCGTNKKSIKVCPVAFGETGVKQRVKSVLNYKKPAFWIIIIAVIASIAVAVCFLTNPKKEDNNNIQTDSRKGNVSMTYFFPYSAENDAVSPRFKLNPNDNTAMFSSSIYSSYLGVGKYTLNGNNLTIKSDDGEYILVFNKKNNSYFFDAESSSNGNKKVDFISDGMEFNPEPLDLGSVVSEVILTENSKKDWLGECHTEGHIILGKEESGDKTKIYALTEFASFGFENGYFTNVGGETAPAVVTVNRKTGEYSIQYPKDGEYYSKSIYKMFPQKYQTRAFGENDQDYSDMWNQCVSQAKEYLESIGRKAEVKSWGDVPHTLFTDIGMPVDISNNLENYIKTYNYYEYIGSEEVIENGTRYVYRTSYLEDKNTLLFSKEIYGENKVVNLIQMNIKTGEIISMASDVSESQICDFIDAEIVEFKDNILTVKAHNDSTVYKVDTSAIDKKLKPDSFYDGLHLRIYFLNKGTKEKGNELSNVFMIAIYGDVVW